MVIRHSPCSVCGVTDQFKMDLYHITNYCGGCSFDSYLAMRWMEIRKTHKAFLDKLAPLILDVNPLPILARAVNSLKLRGIIFQPCWRATRWKSKT